MPTDLTIAAPNPSVWYLIPFILAVYVLPSLIALIRQHPYKNYIFGLNILAGWTGLFWFIALIWSFYKTEGPLRYLRK